jgi:hypothetical protein
MIDKTVKNLADRLYRKGLNISKVSIKEYVVSEYGDKDLTDIEKNTVVAYFIEKSSGLAVSKETIDITPTDESGQAALPNLETARPLDLYKPANSSLSVPQVTSIVFEQVEILGLDLKSSDIRAIGNKLTDMNVAASDAVSMAVSLIREYVGIEEERHDNNLAGALNQVVSEVNASYARRSEKTSQAFSILSHDLEVSATAYKSGLEQFKADVQDYFAVKKS